METINTAEIRNMVILNWWGSHGIKTEKW